MSKKRKKRCPNGTVRQLKNGKYTGRVPIGYTGERYVYQIVSGQTKAEVKKDIAQLRLKYDNVELTEESLMPLSSWMNYWLNEVKKPMISYTTYDNYKCFIEKHINPLLGSKKLIRITPDDITRFVERLQAAYPSNKKTKAKKRLAFSTIHEIYCVLSAALKAAVGAGYIPENPCKNISLPKQAKAEPPILLSEDIYSFLSVLKNDSYWYPLFYLELMTGLRRGELCGLKWEDFIPETRELRIQRSIKYYYQQLIQTSTKTNAGRRTVLLSPSVVALLIERKKHTDSDWMFCSEGDSSLPLDPQTITAKLKEYFALAGIKYTRFHNLRHTFATQAVSNGVEPETLSILMGHADPVFTLNTYTHCTPDILTNAVKYMDMLLDSILGD